MPSKSKDGEGISFEDLLGKYVDVLYTGIKANVQKGVPKIVIDVEYDGNPTSFGIIGEDVKKSVLSRGRKDGEKIYLSVPQNILKMSDDGKVQWLTVPLD